MARGRRFIRNNQQPAQGVDLDARRVLAIESRHDPKDPPCDYMTAAETKRPAQPAQAVTMPTRPALCHCGSKEFYIRGVRWVCSQCQPQQPGQRIAARDVVTMPAALSEHDQRELAQAWQLVNAKRAADGLAPMPAITAQPKQPTQKELDALRKEYLKMAHDSARVFGHKARPESYNRFFDVLLECSTLDEIRKIIALNKPSQKSIDETLKDTPVVFYSLMGIEAARRGSGSGGAFRLWTLARALDTSGSGRVKRDDLRAFVFSLGVNRQTWKRWYSDAMRLEMFKEGYRRDGWYMYFANAGIIGAALGCVDGVGRRVTLAAHDLVGYGWKARIFAAHETTYNERPIARETMQKKINVARSTQQYREARAGVKKIINIAKMGKGADFLSGMVEYDRNPRAWFTDKNGELNRRLPNSYQYKNAALSARGRGKKVNRIIRGILHSQQQGSLSLMGQAQSFIDADEAQPTREAIRLYNQTPDQTKATKKKIQHNDPRRAVVTIYEYQRKAKRSARVVYWAALAVA